MKSIIFLILLLITTCFYSCDKPAKPVVDAGQPITSIGMQHLYANVYIYIIDSCEYVGNVSGGYCDWAAHKGNCKFCIERNKNCK